MVVSCSSFHHIRLEISFLLDLHQSFTYTPMIRIIPHNATSLWSFLKVSFTSMLYIIALPESNVKTILKSQRSFIKVSFTSILKSCSSSWEAWQEIFKSAVVGDIELGRSASKFLFFLLLLFKVVTQPLTIMNCPQDMWISISKYANGSVVTWNEPSVSGNATMIAQTHVSGDWFYLGATNVFYFFTDSSNNWAICSFNVRIEQRR